MKQFFGAFFGSIIGIIISTLLALFLIIAVVKASISKVSEKEEPITIIKNNSILKFVIDGAIVDRNLEEDPLNELKKITPLGGIEDSNKGLNLLVQKIKTAKNDDNIKGIYLYFKSLQAGFATTEELRNALIDFKSAGKCQGNVLLTPITLLSEAATMSVSFMINIGLGTYCLI